MSSESDKQTKTTSTRREKAIAALFNDEPSKKTDKKNKKGIDKKTDKPREDEVESADMSITVSKKADTLQYQKLQLRDQILLRPDTYIGSVKTNLTPDPVYYLDDKTKMFKKGFLQLNDGLLRLFIEAISNAIDNVWRSVEFGIPVKFIKVTITKDKIGIWNDGRNITCATHPTEGIPIPEMIFGHLLTSSNYNDNEERKTSGKNGLGIKLACCFSRIFRIAIYNKSEKVVYTQEWNDNMKNCEEPVTVNKGFPKTAVEGSNGFTYVEFFPDFARFGMKEFDMDHIAMLRKITYDAAMTVSFHGVKVLLNEEEIPIHNVKEYVSHYFEGQLPEEHVLLNSQDCKVAIVGGDIDDFTQISFVNGIQTKDGGVHVDGWTKALFDGLSEKLSSKKMQITARDLKRHFFIYVFASLDKPAFNDQSKNKLNSPKVTVDLKQTVINKVAKWKFVEKIESSMKAKELTSLKETTERKRGRVVIRKLNEATLAGTKDSKDCILAITEGESAKGYVVSGIEYGVFGKKGNKYIGVMPIKGKFLNVKNAKLATLKDNEEVGALIKALGLQHGVDYTIEENRKKLRYGKFLMVADSDADGSHIAGLIYNFFHTLFPTLLEVPGFFNYMRTPILKIVKRNEKLAFFFLEQAHKYIESHKIGKEHIKYYKGLGTSNAEDIKEDFGRRIVSIVKDDKTDEMMEKVFATEHSDFRKNWIQEFTPRTEFPKLKDYEIEQLNASDFLNFEMILFSLADNARSIPKVLDGLKESQRKILYTAFHRNLNYESKSFKVAQFGASVAEQTNYHYGENSLFEAITKMAQNFAGSNNIPLLYADGNFGSRMGHLEKGVGGNAASPRYIFTKLECLTRLMFRPEDDDYLPNIEDEGAKIEKEYYLPIVPTALINGCEGIGSGWRSEVPMFNIIDIISWITAWLEGTGKPTLKPWYRGFKGEVTVSGKTVTTKGLLEEVSANVYRVTEIPIGLSIEKFLDKIKDFQEEGLVKDIVNNDNTSNTVDYTFKTTGDVDLKKLGLISTFSMNTMVFFDSKGKLKRYESVEEILEEFCVRRFEFYTVRKAGELRKMRHKLLVHEMKARFISDVLSGAIVLRGKDEDVLSAELEKKAYAKVDGDYDYLLTIQVRSMTAKRVEQLHESIAEIKAKIKEYESKSEKSLWVDELKELVAAYQKSYFVAEPTVKKATIAKKR